MTEPRADEAAHDYIERLLTFCVEQGASDVYLIPGQDVWDVRMRVDGEQQSVAVIDADYAQRAAARVKVLSGCLTYRTKVAQDGVIRQFNDSAVELRVAVLPSRYGERITIRVLNSVSGPRYIEDLGVSDDQQQALQQLLDHESGLILFTGPTGSGKSKK